jgi:hypothetical protein
MLRMRYLRLGVDGRTCASRIKLRVVVLENYGLRTRELRQQLMKVCGLYLFEVNVFTQPPTRSVDDACSWFYFPQDSLDGTILDDILAEKQTSR